MSACRECCCSRSRWRLRSLLHERSPCAERVQCCRVSGLIFTSWLNLSILVICNKPWSRHLTIFFKWSHTRLTCSAGCWYRTSVSRYALLGSGLDFDFCLSHDVRPSLCMSVLCRWKRRVVAHYNGVALASRLGDSDWDCAERASERARTRAGDPEPAVPVLVPVRGRACLRRCEVDTPDRQSSSNRLKCQ